MYGGRSVMLDEDITGREAAAMYRSIASGYEQQRSDGPDGGTSTGSSGAGAGSPGAVQQGLPQTTGGGPRFQTGAANVRAFIPERMGNFYGVDTYTPPQRMSENYAPWGYNWDDFASMGSRCVRRGTAKMDFDRDAAPDGSQDCILQMIAAGDHTADTDYIRFTLPDATTHAFWFDTTGGDTEPAGSQAADDSDAVNVSGASDAESVAQLLITALATASIGLTGVSNGAGLLTITSDPFSFPWVVAEVVTNAGFAIDQAFTNTGNAISANYRGLSVTRIPGDGTGPDQLLVAFADNTIGSVPSALPTALYVVSAMPSWGRQFSLEGMPGPVLVVSQVAGPKIRVNPSYTSFLPATGQVKASVEAVIIRYSTIAFPEDPHGHDDGTSSVAIQDENTAWNGVATNIDSATLATGTYYVSVWGVSLLGISRPTYAKITLT
jgi:hypothetical protein